MYYACENMNIIFIEMFSHYSFGQSENNPNVVNYSLFLETNNSKTPLEILYEKLNKKDDNVIKLLIDVSINTKQVYFIPVIKYLIQNYNPQNNRLFEKNYKIFFNSFDYLKKIIGLYLFYTKELNGNIMVKDEYGNDPFFICAQNNNYSFLFNVLLEEHNICLNSTNSEGKSIIHIILEISGYLNTYKEETLKQAIESGFDFNIKDKEDMLPIDYAYYEKDYNIINKFINYYVNFGMEIPENRNKIPKNVPKYDFCKDADNFYNESIAISSKIDKNENLNELVSPFFKNYDDNSFYLVCLEEGSNIPYTANLRKNNVTYCIQLLKNVLKNNYLVITIYNDKMEQQFPYNDLNIAKLQFKQIFKNKTDNDWDEVKNNKSSFKNDYTNFYIFDYSYEEEDAIYEYLKQTIKYLYIDKKIEFNGNKKIKNLIYNLLVKSYKNKFSVDDNSSIIEKKTKDIIEKYKWTAMRKAGSILEELKKLLHEENKDEAYIKKRVYLINSYNDLIPYSHNSKDYSLFDNEKSIDNEISRLTTYYYIENVLKLFLGAIYNLKNMHPLDYIINALGCKMEEMPKPENTQILMTEADYIYNYLYSTISSNHRITSIYKITQSNNDKNFNLNNFQNRYIFCHGTKPENILGILSQGLKNAPVEAVHTGKMYGSGIYLSDKFSTSIYYCYPRNRLIDQKAYMLLVETAVGKTGKDEDTYIVSMNMDFDDVFITNEGYGIFKNSKKINVGSSVIVVHDETNVRIKYLVEIN